MTRYDPWDRTVHGTGTDEDGLPYEVARYDRVSRYYIEYRNNAKRRRQVTIGQAVEATQTPFLDKPGGQIFDARYRRKQAQ